MNYYYLRVEGVNLGNFVFDTGDLSTIRGGGLLMLEAPGWIKDQLEAEGIHLKPITQGASWGLFSFKAGDKKEAADVAANARDKFSSNANYHYATMVVDVLQIDEKTDYALRRESLTALSRWRQMASLSTAIPETVDVDKHPTITDTDGERQVTVCQLDHARPATQMIEKGETQYGVCESVYARRGPGISQKSAKWYKTITKMEGLPGFVRDFDELTRPGKEPGYGQLNHKMAVIYLDGNHFGRRQRNYCTEEGKQEEFDKKIREDYQNCTLGSLLQEIKEKPDWLIDIAGVHKLRFETLLWGGDEAIWVVPAWQGWWWLARFFQMVAQTWKFFDNSDLTLSAGLVFCHHNAPIRRITSLAKTLGDLAKGDRSANRVAYQVLESFDHAGVDVTAFRQSRCPDGVTAADLILEGNTMFDLIAVAEKLKKQFPKRRLHRHVAALYQGVTDHRQELIVTLDRSLFQHLMVGFGPEPACWIHLLELWDYLAPDIKKNEETEDVPG